MTTQEITIHKPDRMATFKVGADIFEGDHKTDNTVIEITVNLFRTVKIKLSNNTVIVFAGFPISYIK